MFTLKQHDILEPLPIDINQRKTFITSFPHSKEIAPQHMTKFAQGQWYRKEWLATAIRNISQSMNSERAQKSSGDRFVVKFCKGDANFYTNMHRLVPKHSSHPQENNKTSQQRLWEMHYPMGVTRVGAGNRNSNLDGAVYSETILGFVKKGAFTIQDIVWMGYSCSLNLHVYQPGSHSSNTQHPYPSHPVTGLMMALQSVGIVKELTPESMKGFCPKTLVIDPCCGCGDLLWQAMLFGHDVMGLDINQKYLDDCYSQFQRIEAMSYAERLYIIQQILPNIQNLTLPSYAVINGTVIDHVKHHTQHILNILKDHGLYQCVLDDHVKDIGLEEIAKQES